MLELFIDFRLDFIKIFNRSNYFSFKFVMSIFWQSFFCSYP
jgi:hypothetical protein